MSLKDKVVIVTGASRGIGGAIAKICAREGAKLVLNYFRKEDEKFGAENAITQVIKEVKNHGSIAVAVEGDVANPLTAEKLVETAIEKFNGVDILVANAGIAKEQNFVEIKPEEFEKVIGVNLGGVFYAIQAVAKRLVEQKRGGAIVAISSIRAFYGDANMPHYHASKSGVHSLIQSAAIAFGPHKIRCNSVMPGWIDTDQSAEATQEERDEYINNRIPLKRIGNPDDVAECVAFLASDRAAYVTGAHLEVDGGLLINSR